MKELKRKSQPLREFETILVSLPFLGLSPVETASLPWWRVMAEDCAVLFQTNYVGMDIAFKLIDSWDLRYVCCVPANKRVGLQKKSQNPCVVAVKGQADLLYDISEESILSYPSTFQALNAWGSPRLAINYPYLKRDKTFTEKRGWVHTMPTGSWDIDPFYYPLRKNGLDVDESLTDLLNSMRQEWRNANHSKWKVLEMFAIMLANSRQSKSNCLSLVRQAIDIKPLTLRLWMEILTRIHSGEINPSFSEDIKIYEKLVMPDVLNRRKPE